jgi:hypothetical protein
MPALKTSLSSGLDEAVRWGQTSEVELSKSLDRVDPLKFDTEIIKKACPTRVVHDVTFCFSAG